MTTDFEKFDLSVGDSNAIILPGKKNKTQGRSQGKITGPLSPPLSKSQKRKLMKLQEEKEKKALELKSIKILEKHKIRDEAHSLLQSSGTIGQVETMREKRRRAVQFCKAGLECPLDVPPFKKSRAKKDVDDDDFYLLIREEKDDFDNFGALDNASKKNCNIVHQTVGSETVLSSPEIAIVSGVQEDQSSTIPSCIFERGNGSVQQGMKDSDSKLAHQSISLVPDSAFPKLNNTRTIVHVSRPSEVETKRADLPVVMMEQEIMEAINDHSTTIVCGETGCGKTTQVPQFLYEAGFGSSKCSGRKGIIGVTQPRRVAVLATAKRVAFELGLCLGKEIGFQVRHDKMIGASCSIKFMTDGILLREVQNDFLLKRYSVILLDEAHERSLNTDILIGMLSRVIQVRQKLYEEQQERVISGFKIATENMITPLKLVLMSATLRVEDFVSNTRLFCVPPPVIEVATRQFPVTAHFSKRTEIVDYMGQAYKKVLSIHKRLPPGGILVFVTGQREVEYLCTKLRKASQKLIKDRNNRESGCEIPPLSDVAKDDQGPIMKDINEAFESGGQDSGNQSVRFNSYDGDQDDLEDPSSFDSEMESDLEADSDEEDSFSNEKKEETSMDAFKDPGNIALLKAAFEALSGKTSEKDCEEKALPSITPSAEGSGSKHKSEVGSSGALYVLPLYAMLPASAQLRVFGDVHEEERLVVVATNVAETSLTIPGIKYVVDTGREKVKNYNYANGMATYEVQWISKASAAQRAGRAGRTGPGHCYRLYSSAVFNNIFPDFSTAEITKTPVDGVVLLMKYMGIDKVENFPFPTPPEAKAVAEADHCLKVLEALDTQGRLTPIGKAMARYPMSARHSRMLLTVIQIMRKQQNYARANLVLSYAVAAAAALSFSNPFITQLEGYLGNIKDGLDQDEKHSKNVGEHAVKDVGRDGEKILDHEEKLRQKKLKSMVKEARVKFGNPSSDALTIAYALQLFELSENRVEFCSSYALHFKTMDEMSKLRKQLLQLVFSQSLVDGLHQEFLWTQGKIEDVEHAWRVSSEKHPLLLNEEELLGQAICAGWADRVAKRIRTVTNSDKERKVNAARYQACMVNETVFLHRWSSVSLSGPEYLVYNELLNTKRPYMYGLTSVKPVWLVKYASTICTFSSPLTDPRPYYEPLNDQVLCWVSPTFGPHLWQLPLHSVPIKNDLLRVSVFSCALLEGNVLPCLKSAKKFLAAPPASILKPEAAGQKRVGNLLSKLMTKRRTIDSRALLRETWDKNPEDLHSEILNWFQESFHGKFKELWIQMHSEVVLETEELFPKKLKKVKKNYETLRKTRNRLTLFSEKGFF